MLLLSFKVQKGGSRNDHKGGEEKHTDQENHKAQSDLVEKDQAKDNVHENLGHQKNKNVLDFGVMTCVSVKPWRDHK